MTGLFVIFIVFSLIFGLWCFYCFDEVIKHQYHKHHDSWVAAGRPHGFFFKPHDAAWHFTTLFMLKYAKHLRDDPKWAEADPIARELIRRNIKNEKLWKLYCLKIVPVLMIVFLLLIIAT